MPFHIIAHVYRQAWRRDEEIRNEEIKMKKNEWREMKILGHGVA